MAERHELAALLVDKVRELSAARGERDAFRLLAVQAVHRHELPSA